MSALVSVIMPAYEPRGDWLREAVRSVLAERGCPLELIVVDDGSAEPVDRVLGEISDDRLRVLRIEHAGPYAARDAGLREARGTHVRFFDADDLAEPGSTAALLALAGDDEVLAYGATVMCDEALCPLRTVTSDSEGDVTEEMVLGGFDVYVVSILFPRAVLDRAGTWAEAPFPVSGDWDYVLRAAEHAAARRLDAVVTRYRRHGTSVTRTAGIAAGVEAGRLVLERYFARHPEQAGTALERRAFARLHLDRAEAFATARCAGPGDGAAGGGGAARRPRGGAHDGAAGVARGR